MKRLASFLLFFAVSCSGRTVSGAIDAGEDRVDVDAPISPPTEGTGEPWSPPANAPGYTGAAPWQRGVVPSQIPEPGVGP